MGCLRSTSAAPRLVCCWLHLVAACSGAAQTAAPAAAAASPGCTKAESAAAAGGARQRCEASSAAAYPHRTPGAEKTAALHVVAAAQTPAVLRLLAAVAVPSGQASACDAPAAPAPAAPSPLAGIDARPLPAAAAPATAGLAAHRSQQWAQTSWGWACGPPRGAGAAAARRFALQLVSERRTPCFGGDFSMQTARATGSSWMAWLGKHSRSRGVFRGR
jgi:hypothetical protein